MIIKNNKVTICFQKCNIRDEPKWICARTFSVHSQRRSDLELNLYWPGKGGGLGPIGESYTIAHVTPCPPDSQGFQYCTVFFPQLRLLLKQ